MRTRSYKFLFLSFLLFSSFLLSAQNFEDGYDQVGFGAGRAFNSEKQGFCVDILHMRLFSPGIFLEMSSCKISNTNAESNQTKMILLDLLSFDLGLGLPIGKNFYIGVSPFSINYTQAPGYGLAIFTKIRVGKFVLENKIIPKSYIKGNEYTILNNNFYVGMDYWVTKKFSLGLRYSVYNYNKDVSLMVAWDAWQLNLK